MTGLSLVEFVSRPGDLSVQGERRGVPQPLHCPPSRIDVPDVCFDQPHQGLRHQLGMRDAAFLGYALKMGPQQGGQRHGDFSVLTHERIVARWLCVASLSLANKW